MNDELIEQVARAMPKDFGYAARLKMAQAAIAAMREQLVPVAWMYEHNGREQRHVTISRDVDPDYVTQSLGFTETPLYAFPAAPTEGEG